MPGLLDIAPLTETVTVSGVAVEVYGISATGVALLMQRFPEIRALVSGREIDASPERLFELVPHAIASIIAAGCGLPGDQAAERIAGRLPVAEQLELMRAILRLTLPAGIAPFVEGLQELLGGLNVAADPATS